MVADTESSDSLAGSSNAAAAAEKPADGSLDKSSQEKAPRKTHKAEREKLKRDQLNDLFLELTSMLATQRTFPIMQKEKAPRKTHKAEREKLKRDQLNDLFLELTSMLDLDRQNSGKATVLGDAARVLRDLVTQVESLRKEQSALLTERQYVSSEKNELQEENTTLKAQILVLQNELRARMGNNSLNLSSLGMSHPIGSNSPNLATHPMPRHIWSNGSNLSTLPMTQPTNTLSPLQNLHHHSADSGQVYVPRPQELQLFPGTSASLERERSQHRSTPATSSSLTDSLPGQLRLSLPQTSQEESSSGALGSRKERKNG